MVAIVRPPPCTCILFLLREEEDGQRESEWLFVYTPRLLRSSTCVLCLRDAEDTQSAKCAVHRGSRRPTRDTNGGHRSFRAPFMKTIKAAREQHCATPSCVRVRVIATSLEEGRCSLCWWGEILYLSDVCTSLDSSTRASPNFCQENSQES